MWCDLDLKISSKISEQRLKDLLTCTEWVADESLSEVLMICSEDELYKDCLEDDKRFICEGEIQHAAAKKLLINFNVWKKFLDCHFIEYPNMGKLIQK